MYVDAPNQRLIVKTGKFTQIAQLTPDAVRLASNIVALPHDDRHIQILQHLGAKVEGFEPIHYYWDWPTLSGQYELRPDQKAVAAFFCRHDKSYCLNPPRMGKTASSLCTLLYQLDKGIIQAALIICPLTAVGDWRRELFAMRPNEVPVVLHGKHRGALSKSLTNRIFLINPDGARAISKELVTAVAWGRIGAIVVDELTDYSTRTTLRWKAVRAIVQGVRYLYGLTGTPGTALQTFGQMSLINPHAHLPRSFKHWRDSVATNPYGFRWVERPDAKDVVFRMMQPAIRFSKEDVLKLPTPQIEFIDAEHTPAQERAYKEVKAKQRMMEGNATVTAVNAGVLVSKLLQISAGSVRTDDGRIVEYDVTPRIDALEHLILHKSESKVVIFASYRAVMARVAKELEDRGISTAQIHGGISANDRPRIINDFTNSEHPRVLIAHPITARYSLELAAADTIVFYGPAMSGAYTYEQAKNRILSPKQKSLTPAIVHLQSSYSERALFKALIDGVDAQRALVNLFTEELAATL